MTEEQMRKRMKEIDAERDKLRDEKKQYEDYFYNKKKQEQLDNHKNHIGKCFFIKDVPGNEQRYIKAFKVLEIKDNPKEEYALCLVLIDGTRYTCWNEYGIQIMTLGLWTPNKIRLMSSEYDSKVIDFYEEITQKEFENMYETYKQRLDENVK